ncbi:MAG: hypothetical protein WC775_00735 [Patescibacteria group bacterium]|jgi:uncharacterized BrkB/YihY/UPF0761 family membrane protein
MTKLLSLLLAISFVTTPNVFFRIASYLDPHGGFEDLGLAVFVFGLSIIFITFYVFVFAYIYVRIFKRKDFQNIFKGSVLWLLGLALLGNLFIFLKSLLLKH